MYVGVIPKYADAAGDISSIPHVCGGDPQLTRKYIATRVVFPMYVGVILGGCKDDETIFGYSPCMWG